MLSIMALNTESCYAECHLCLVSFILIVANKSSRLSVIMMNVVMLNVVALKLLRQNLDILRRANPTMKYWSTFTHTLCNLYHFRAIG